MRHTTIIGASTAFVMATLGAASALAAEHVMDGHISIVPSEITWTDATSIGSGAKLAILEGDLEKSAPFTFRVKLPPNSEVAPHTHPVFERVTVLSGTFHLGIGERFDAAKARAYPAGGITMMPPGMPMFAFTGKEGAVIQVHGTGPWGITYLDPADDPRRK